MTVATPKTFFSSRQDPISLPRLRSMNSHAACFNLYFATCENYDPLKSHGDPLFKWGSCWLAISSSCRKPWQLWSMTLVMFTFPLISRRKTTTSMCSIMHSTNLTESLLLSLLLLLWLLVVLWDYNVRGISCSDPHPKLKALHWDS